MLLLFLFLSASFALAGDDESAPIIYNFSEMQKPSCLGQSGAAILNWLQCSCSVAAELFACCAPMPEPICDDPTSCNPLQRRYVDPYRPAQEGEYHDALFLAFPCCYRNQILND